MLPLDEIIQLHLRSGAITSSFKQEVTHNNIIKLVEICIYSLDAKGNRLTIEE